MPVAPLGREPLFSIVTPVLNGARYLDECLQSVLGQTYRHVEHVLVDGGSTDGSLELLRGYAARHPERIRFISGKDRNAEDATNKGILLSRGDVVGWLGADDVLLPDAVRTVADFFRANPDAYLVYGACDEVDAEGRFLQRLGMRDFDLQTVLDQGESLPFPSTFFRRSVVAVVGLLGTERPPGDFEFWLRVATRFRVHRLDSVLSRFRLHPGSTTGNPASERRYALVTYLDATAYGGRLWSPRALGYVKAELRARLGPLYPERLIRRLRPLRTGEPPGT
jgi:glycosyltransferase involved in cell wall biosynthesis